jgi:hypothetical protein
MELANITWHVFEHRVKNLSGMLARPYKKRGHMPNQVEIPLRFQLLTIVPIGAGPDWPVEGLQVDIYITIVESVPKIKDASLVTQTVDRRLTLDKSNACLASSS